MCDKEQEVLEAVQSGRLASAGASAWAEELRRHIAACSECADLVLAAEYLRNEGEAAAAEMHLPSASFVFWKAQLRARRESTERALRPVRIAEKAAAASSVAVAGSLLLWKGPALGGWFSSLRDFQAVLPGFLNSSFALATGTALVCVMGFVLYAVFAKE